MSIENFYDKTMTVARYSEKKDDSGALDLSGGNWSTIFSSVACMLRPLSASQKVSRGKTITDKVFIVQCAVMAILTGDRLTIDGVAYTVIGNPKDPNSMGHHLEIEAEIVS